MVKIADEQYYKTSDMEEEGVKNQETLSTLFKDGP